MAGTWEEYFYGTPEQAAADSSARAKAWQALQESRDFQDLRGREPLYDPAIGRTIDPREVRMAMALESMPQNQMRTTDFGEDAMDAINYGMQAGTRMRDTSLRGVQELASGNVLQGVALASRSPLAVFYPPAAAGTPGAADDWRPKARAAGVPESHIMAFDIGTDPENWIAAPVRGPAAFVVPALQYKILKTAAQSDAALRAVQAARKASQAMDTLRYGRGAPVYLERAGETIMRLPNAPGGPIAPLLLR